MHTECKNIKSKSMIPCIYTYINAPKFEDRQRIFNTIFFFYLCEQFCHMNCCFCVKADWTTQNLRFSSSECHQQNQLKEKEKKKEKNNIILVNSC